MENYVIAHISTKGDLSVGLPPFETEVNLQLLKDEIDSSEWDEIRTELESCFTNIWCEDTTCIFSFELQEMNNMIDKGVNHG